MATSISNGNLIPFTSANQTAGRPAIVLTATRPRKLLPEKGRAIEILAHAIEHLSDEFALTCMDRILGTSSGMHPQIQAIELLKQCNREIYLSCPEIPPLSQRLRAWLRKN